MSFICSPCEGAWFLCVRKVACEGAFQSCKFLSTCNLECNLIVVMSPLEKVRSIKRIEEVKVSEIHKWWINLLT